MNTPTLTQQTRANIEDIEIGMRLRPVSQAGVASLIASFNEVGVIKDAIHVRKKHDGTLHLIAGAHRIAAARELGWADIEVKVWTDVTDDWARLMEIDDNLAGAEMNALDTAVFLAMRKEVYERLHPETRAKTGAALAANRWNAADIMSVASFASTTAEKFGLTDRHVRRMIAVGKSLDRDQIDALRASSRPVKLDDLQVLAKVTTLEERSFILNALCAEAPIKASAARADWKRHKQGVESPAKQLGDAHFVTLMNAWNRAGPAARARFCEEAGLTGGAAE